DLVADGLAVGSVVLVRIAGLVDVVPRRADVFGGVDRVFLVLLVGKFHVAVLVLALFRADILAFGDLGQRITDFIGLRGVPLRQCFAVRGGFELAQFLATVQLHDGELRGWIARHIDQRILARDRGV